MRVMGGGWEVYCMMVCKIREVVGSREEEVKVSGWVLYCVGG